MRARICVALLVGVLTAAVQGQELSREERLAPLRQRAQERAAQDRQRYREPEIVAIEARYRQSRLDGMLTMVAPDAEPLLLELIAMYPASNRAGCAAMDLAQLKQGAAREAALKDVLAHHGDAWFDNGSQVGALARAQLAIYYAGIDRFDDAERLAAEVVQRFPDAVDRSGAPLADFAEGIRLLRAPK
jgi:hypothetical protein